MPNITNRNADHCSERAVDEYLNRFVYKKLFKKFQPISDTKQQLAGIDIIVNNEMYIDNKAMTDPQYLNNPANSFILEIASFNHGAYQLGWFLNDNLQTTHYMFVWLPDVNVPTGSRLVNSRQIQKIEIMLVNRDEVHQLINTYISDEELKERAKKVVRNNMKEDFIVGSPLKICYSTHKAEGPITLKVPKFVYKKIAIKHCYVTPTEIIDIK